MMLMKKDVEWRIGSIFDYKVGGPGFDSHPGLHFLEALISLFLTMDYKAYSNNFVCLLSSIILQIKRSNSVESGNNTNLVFVLFCFL